jgi:hypothetical protein
MVRLLSMQNPARLGATLPPFGLKMLERSQQLRNDEIR